jgi:hypothetical protein
VGRVGVGVKLILCCALFKGGVNADDGKFRDNGAIRVVGDGESRRPKLFQRPGREHPGQHDPQERENKGTSIMLMNVACVSGRLDSNQDLLNPIQGERRVNIVENTFLSWLTAF